MPKIVDKQQRRDQIIDATFRVIVKDGLAGTSMRAVAKEASCTIGLINHWFASRDDLVEAAFDRAIEQELDRAAKSVTDAASYIDAASRFLPLDRQSQDHAKIWIAFYAMVLCEGIDERRRSARCKAVRKVMVAGLSAFYDLKVCHNIVDRVFVLVDGIAINALLDPSRWNRRRQITVLSEGLEHVLNRQVAKPT
ncbi:MAG: TetR/AcrR family transcriptional regulator [Pseudomonadota bacterium]